MLHDEAKKAGCNKVALGHHLDDAVETFMLNLFFEGRVGCFSPVTYLSKMNIHMIRPLLYAREKDIRYFAGQNSDLPVTPSLCPEDRDTERARMKDLLRELEGRYPGLRHRLFGALCRSEIDGFRPLDRMLRTYEKKEKSDL